MKTNTDETSLLKEELGNDIFIGVDLHKTQFTVCVRGQKKEEMIQYPTSKDGYEQMLKKIRRWRKRTVSR